MPVRTRAALFAATVSLAGCAAPPASAPAANVSIPLASFAPLVKRVVPSVVQILVTEGDASAAAVPDLRGTPAERLRRRAVLGAGSGFIVDPSGIIVTNTHVVGHASRIAVTLSDGTELPAQVIGIDPLTDIAVIRVRPAQPLQAVTWGDSRAVQVGDWIMAAGNPFGVGISVTAGIVSARGRDIGAGPFDDFLQIDAPINPGNSGGPTFNVDGQVVAVNTAIVSPTGGSVGIGFAIPSDEARGIVDSLRAKGHIERGWLGVSVEDMADGSGHGSGVTIASIERGGPAARAGLHTGDVVLAVNDTKVDTTQGLIRAVAAVPPGNAVQLTVRRGGQTIEIPVTVGLRPTETRG